MQGVTDRDRGYRALKAALAAVGSPRVYAGILQDVGSAVTEEGGDTLAGYAAKNEFGTRTIPERSFMRSTVDKHEAKYAKALEKAMGAMVDDAVSGGEQAGLSSLRKSMDTLGVRLVADIQTMIRDVRTPPNAPSTLAAKYPGDNPLIHTGRMRQSIAHKVEL